MTVNRAKELSYELFFILMIFAKGIGLDSGNRLYYILSGLACVCVGVKLVLTRYRIREIVAMACLCAIAFVAYLNSGRMGIVLSALTVAGLKDMDVKNALGDEKAVPDWDSGLWGFVCIYGNCGKIRGDWESDGSA